jgi:hypothetical protein
MEEDLNFKQLLAEEEARLTTYLDSTAVLSTRTNTTRRVACCNSSRAFYCPECCKILIPQDEWPRCFFQNGGIALPFTMDIVLGWKQRRTSSSGIQMMAICNMMKEASLGTKDGDDELQKGSEGLWWNCMNLYDMNQGDKIPSYSGSDNSTTFVLFPKKDSVPLSAVADKISKLVVLDVLWTRSGVVQLNSSLSSLPSVHLEFPPKQSHFWRWHDKGCGMLSTMEAIYFAAMEVSLARRWAKKDREQIINIMYLFALQRSAIIQRHSRVSVAEPLPFSSEGKAKQRDARIRKD